MIKRIDPEYNPFIDSTRVGADKDESFAISAIESYGGESYRTDSEGEPRQSVDMFGNEHLNILTHLANSNAVGNPGANLEASFQNNQSYSHGHALSSIDSSRVVIGERTGSTVANVRQFSADSPMYLSRSVTRGATDSLDKI